MVRRSEPSETVRSSERFDGKGGLKVAGSMGLCAQFRDDMAGVAGSSKEGPLRTAFASERMLCRRWSWEDMKGAECLSPVQRVMSTQSRD